MVEGVVEVVAVEVVVDIFEKCVQSIFFPKRLGGGDFGASGN